MNKMNTRSDHVIFDVFPPIALLFPFEVVDCTVGNENER
jgi:hypothetical protein